MQQPLVSIILPCYNGELFIEDALRSILKQTYKNIEIICINDCSTDNTSVILERLAKEDDRIKIVHNEVNLRLIGTLNKGIEIASGTYIARMDADDISGNKRIEIQVEEMLKDNTLDIVSINPTRISYKGNILSQNPYFACSLTGSCKFMSLFATPIVHPSVLIKGEILKKYRYIETEKYLHIEDGELWVRMFYSGCSIKVLQDSSLFYFRNNKDSVTKNHHEKQFQNFVNFSLESIHKYLGFVVSEDVIRVLLGHKGPIKKELLQLVISDFTKLKKNYTEKYKITVKEKREIESWYEQRLLYILTNCFASGDFKLRLYITLKIFENPSSLFRKISLKNMYLRIKWNLLEKNTL